MKSLGIIFIFIIGVLMVWFWSREGDKKAFEAGAHLIVLQHQTFGHYGSQAMRDSITGFEPMYQDDIDSGLMTAKEAFNENLNWFEDVYSDTVNIQRPE